MSPFRFVRKAVSVVAGLASKQRRTDSAQRLLAYTLVQLPDMELYLEFAPTLPGETLESAKLYPDRVAMLSALTKGGIVAEVGTFKGSFSRHIAEICRPDKFHLIDIDFSPLGPIPMPVEKHQGDSSTILSSFPSDYFHWLYIDGDHSYGGVTRDLKAAHRALKSGGFLICNDYANWCSASAVPYGVAKAVNELIMAEGYTVLGLALHPGGLPDIMVQKP